MLGLCHPHAVPQTSGMSLLGNQEMATTSHPTSDIQDISDPHQDIPAWMCWKKDTCGRTHHQVTLEESPS